MITPRHLTILQQAVQLFGNGKIDRAEALCAQARTLAPGNFDVLYVSGAIALQKKKLQEAARWLTQAYNANSTHLLCILRLGQTLLASGRAAQAEQILRQGIRLFPREPELLTHLATACANQGRFAEAVKACEEAVKLKPDFADAHEQLGCLLVTARGHASAEPHFRRVTELSPHSAHGWCNLGISLAYRKNLSEALICFDKTLALEPNLPKAHSGRGLVLERLYRTSEAISEYRRAVELNPYDFEARSCLLLTLHYLPSISRESLFEEHLSYGRLLDGQAPPSPPKTARNERRPIRIGFLSPDLRAHSVAYFLEPLLANLDKTVFEVFLYYDQPAIDWMTERLRALASGWRHVAGASSKDLEKCIRADGLDVLFDLAGHTGFNRLPLFAKRLAPIQATYLGYPDTTGIRCMDFRLSDEHADPLGVADAFCTEKILRFSSTAWCYAPPALSPGIGPPPFESNGGSITFGCFNNFSKITDDAIRAWGKILKNAARSRLILKNHGLEVVQLQEELKERFGHCGLDPSRVHLLGRTDKMEDHLATYNRVDIALDTFPYHGTTTTCEAIWMGVPVISLAGDRHASRVGISLMNAIGHPEWIAADWDQYVRKASELAAASAELSQLRVELRASLARSQLCDHQGQARCFGDAVKRMLAAS